VIVAGFGFRTGATIASLEAALQRAKGDRQVTALATLSRKAAHLAPLARKLDLPLIPVEALAGISTPTQSAASLAAHGTGSVAEAAALAAAGPNARLIARRIVSPDRLATCALAESPSP